MDLDIGTPAPSPKLPDAILRADLVARTGDLRGAARVYEEYLNQCVGGKAVSQLPADHPDHEKAPQLIAKLHFAEAEIVNGAVERALSFHPSGGLWYYSVGTEHESAAGIYGGLIVTHNHPGFRGRARGDTFSPADIDAMRYRPRKMALAEFRVVTARVLCSMQRTRPARSRDPRIGLTIGRENPDYTGYSDAQREALHIRLQEIADSAGLRYVRVRRGR